VFSGKRSVQPDLFVIPLVNGRRPRRFEEVGRLLLAIEVLSPSTARADRVVKRTLFRDQGVPQFWIVDLDSRIIERSTPTEARPEILVDELAWHPEGASSPLVIDVLAYFTAVLDD
jgi:Uma2 family endonuclease